MNLARKICSSSILFSGLTTIVLASYDVDMTKNANETIFEIFESFDKINVFDELKTSVTASPLADSATYVLEPHLFHSFETTLLHSNKTSILCRFDSNTIIIQSPWLAIQYEGYVRPTHTKPNSTSETRFQFRINIDNLSIEDKISSAADTRGPSKTRRLSWNHLYLGFTHNISKSLVPSLVEEIIRYYGIKNKFFPRSYENMLNYLVYDSRHYFLVPNISIGSIDLTNTILRHFPAICSVKTDESRTVTMNIRDFSGSSRVRKILDLGDRIETFEMTWSFHIDSLSITVNMAMNEIDVEAGECSFHESLDGIRTDYNGSGAIRIIEYAIALAIMPSMKFVDRTSTLSASISEVEGYLLQSPYTLSKTNNKTTREYLTINVLPENGQHPQHIQCSVLKRSTFTHRINLADMFGKKYQAYRGPKTIDINFHFNFPSLNISINKPPISNCSSNVNGSCEFQMHNDQDIKVNVSPLTTNLSSSHSSNEVLKIEKQLNSTLLSMIKERIVRTIKPAICIPYDFCSQSMKMVDDFFQSIINDVLRRCSLLKKNKTTPM